VAEASKLLLTTEELAEAPAPAAAPSAPSTITTQITTTAPAATTTAPPTTTVAPAPMANTAMAPLDTTAAMLQPQQQQPPAPTTAYNPNLTNLIDCPHPIDVLMPVGGYQLWAGNRRYRMLVELRRPEFRAAESQQEQARIALDIVRTIQKEGGRFLAAIETPANNSNSTATAPGIVRTTVWRILPETDVLTQLGAALRDEQGRARKRRRQQRRARRRERRRQRRAARQAAVESAAGGGGAANAVKGASAAAGTNPEESLPAGNSALQSLYYVPSYLPNNQGGAEHDDGSISSSTSSSSSEEESLEEPLPLQPPKKKGRGGKRIAGAAVAAVAGTGVPKNQAPKVNFHYKPKPTKSHKAVLEQEGEAELPKGVTVRPSGKWVRRWLELNSLLF